VPIGTVTDLDLNSTPAMTEKKPQTAYDQDKVITDILGRIKVLPEVREARIRELQFLIDAGLYAIDPYKIAERMLFER
jgi:anti-sigma28 factor (negative regulator of flagellin synthesis)